MRAHALCFQRDEGMVAAFLHHCSNIVARWRSVGGESGTRGGPELEVPVVTLELASGSDTRLRLTHEFQAQGDAAPRAP